MYRFKKLIGNTFVIILLAVCSAISFLSNKKLPSNGEIFEAAGTTNSIVTFLAKFNFALPSENRFLGLILVIGLVVLYKKYFSHYHSFNKTVGIIAALFASIMLLGDSFKIAGSLGLLLRGKSQLIISIVYFIGYFTLFYVSLSYLSIYLSAYLVSTKYEVKSYGVIDLRFNCHSFWGCWLIFLLAWSPYLIFFYPGSVNWDAFRQLRYFFGINRFRNHHPVASSVLMGICVKFGQSIYSDNFGIYLYTLLQSFIFSASLTSIIKYMQKLQTPISVCKFFLMFYAFWPIFPGFAQYVDKDTLYVAIYVFYSILFVNFVENPKQFLLVKTKFLFVGISILLCLTRNNGIHVVLLSGIAIMFLKISKKIKIQYGIFLVLLFGLWTIWSNCIIPGLGISKGSTREMLSIPFQQTARYVKYYENEITETEKEAINKVLDYDVLAEKYRPEKSDNIKNTYKNPSITDLMGYFRVWFQQFLKHPGTYIQATIHNTYGYYYPDIGIYFYGGNSFGFGTAIEQSTRINTGFIQISMKKEWEPYRKAIENILYIIQKTPGIGLFFGIGIYTWIIMIMIAYLIKTKHYRSIVAYLPNIVSFLICIASPVNRYMRYFVPIITTVPLLIAYFLHIFQHDTENIE